jgi:hypothetical protein
VTRFVGAWGRLRRRQTIAAGAALGAGLVILMHSRAYEGLLVSLPPLAALALAAWRSERSRLRDHALALSEALLVSALGLVFFDTPTIARPALRRSRPTWCTSARTTHDVRREIHRF